MLKCTLYSYSDAYILVSRPIAITGEEQMMPQKD